MTQWANPFRDAADGQYLEAVRSHGPVSLIATPRSELQCRPVALWHGIEKDATLTDFDQVPLTSKDGANIEGVFVRGKGRVPLTTEMFMAADAPLLAFVESADRPSFRFLLSGSQVSGLVTLSDLQRLPVYALLFELVIAVEMLLMNTIRQICRTKPDAWMEHLAPKQQRTVEKLWQEAQGSNVWVDRLSCASLGHEIQAAIGLGLFERDDATHRQFEALKIVRDLICHAAEFAPTAQDALKIPAMARDAQALAEWLRHKRDSV